MPKVTWQFLEVRSQHLSSFLPQMFSAKAIPGYYLFTRNTTFLCTRFRRSLSDPKYPINIQRFFSVVAVSFLMGRILEGGRQHQTLRFRSSRPRGRCLRLEGRQAAPPPTCLSIKGSRFPSRGWSLSRNPLSPEGAPALTLLDFSTCASSKKGIPGPN